MSNILIVSPQVVVDRANLKLLFFRFDLKAVQDIINEVKADYKVHHRAASSVEFTFDDTTNFNAACLALLMHYGPLNKG